MFLSYLSPIFDLGFGDVLDGHLEAVPVPDPRVDDPKASLAQDVAHLVGLLKGLPPWRGGEAQQEVVRR